MFFTYFPFSSWATLEIEIGGLLTLEATSLLRTVLQKAESVLLVRNLKSYRKQKKRDECYANNNTYLDEKMNVEISASSVLLVRVLYSTSFNEINSLK